MAPANRHDSRLIQATLDACLRPVAGSIIVADRGYYGKPAQQVCAQARAKLIVPVKGGRTPRKICRILKRRWPVERCFAWLNQFRAIATRYDRRGDNYLGHLQLAAALIWCRRLSA